MQAICIVCKVKKYQYCKKREMCSPCYQKWYRINRENISLNYDRDFYPTEMMFIKNYFNHQNWIYQPANFRVNNHRYTPDFYDGERDVFIEVSGTRQAFYQNRDKYHAFIEAYPKIKFEIRKANGKLIPLNADIRGTYPEQNDQKIK